MKLPPNHPPKSSMSNQTKAVIILAFMGIGILLLIILAIFAFRGRFPALAFPASATQTQPFPTLSIPTPFCGSPTLVIGSSNFEIKEMAPAPDGSVSVPAGGNGEAYQVSGTDPQYTFLLSPTPENITLLTNLPESTTATATWSNCNSLTFTLSAPQPGTLSTLNPPDPSTASMAIFVQIDGTGSGLVARGGVTEEQISTFNTPNASGGALAEIGLLETTTSPDGTKIQVRVSIYNYGTTPISLTTNDVSLTPRGAAALAPVRSDPSLPEEIPAASTKEFTFTFPRPATPTATLKVLTVEYDLEGF